MTGASPGVGILGTSGDGRSAGRGGTCAGSGIGNGSGGGNGGSGMGDGPGGCGLGVGISRLLQLSAPRCGRLGTLANARITRKFRPAGA